MSITIGEDAYEVLEAARDDVDDFLGSIQYHGDVFNYLMEPEGEHPEEIVLLSDPYRQLEDANEDLAYEWMEADRSVRDLESVHLSMDDYFQRFHTDSRVSQSDFSELFGFVPSVENYSDFSEAFTSVKNAYELGSREVRERSDLMSEYGLPTPEEKRKEIDAVFRLEEIDFGFSDFQRATKMLHE